LPYGTLAAEEEAHGLQDEEGSEARAEEGQVASAMDIGRRDA
jgi:hypothetical protein